MKTEIEMLRDNISKLIVHHRARLSYLYHTLEVLEKTKPKSYKYEYFRDKYNEISKFIEDLEELLK